MRPLHLLFHIKVGYAFHIRYGFFNFAAQTVKAVKVRAEHLYRYIGACARKHGIDTMGNGLSYFYIDSRKNGKFLTYVIHDFLFRTSLQFKRNFHLTGVYTERMLVKFGTSRFPGHVPYFRNSQQQLFGTPAYAVTFVK